MADPRSLTDDLQPLATAEWDEVRSAPANPSPRVVLLRARAAAVRARSHLAAWPRAAASSERVADAARALAGGAPEGRVRSAFSLSGGEMQEADLLARELERRRVYEAALAELVDAKAAAQEGSAAWAAWGQAKKPPPSGIAWDAMIYGPGLPGEPAPEELRRRALAAAGIVSPKDRYCR